MSRLVIIAFTLLLFSCGIKFQKQLLYDTYSVESEEEDVSSMVVYEDGAGTMWNSLFQCGSFEIVKDVNYKGNAAIKISWNKKQDCPWIGFGNSYSNWAPSDMSTYRNNKALSFYVRTWENKASALPIVIGLEDFTGGGTYLFIDSKKYLYGLTIDTGWTQIVIPMWHFPVDPNDSRFDDFDMHSLKQIKFQLEGTGSFYIDEIKLIDYTEDQYQKMLADVEEMKPKGNMNQTVYREGKLDNDVWGAGKKQCQELKETTDTTNNTYISWEYTTENCEWAKWGINWNDWYQINFRGIEKEAILTLRYKTTNNASFVMSIEDYTGKSSQLETVYAAADTEWKTVQIPLKEFQMTTKGFKLDQIKQIVFTGKNSGTVYIDDIKITQGWNF